MLSSLTHKPGKESEPLSSEKRALGLSAAVAGVAVCGYALFSYGQFCVQKLLPAGDYSIEQIGKALLNSDKFGLLLPFEAVSVLLLACIIGGVVVARRR
ncbi:MAG: NADH-quinone oxidoreductase subunit J [Porphyromonadaceae bacterium]|nr:MAG: NADH-quinone oxidoreductase subunit J [Porphyromonadaceae bacterium]